MEQRRQKSLTIFSGGSSIFWVLEVLILYFPVHHALPGGSFIYPIPLPRYSSSSALGLLSPVFTLQGENNTIL
ncbi:MAG: hypothetical protein LIP77_06510 [Planctomycetes bacterium]|nr:hypothetical protein [Planctomycetota bacterium]